MTSQNMKKSKKILLNLIQDIFKKIHFKFAINATNLDILRECAHKNLKLEMKIVSFALKVIINHINAYKLSVSNAKISDIWVEIADYTNTS